MNKETRKGREVHELEEADSADEKPKYEPPIAVSLSRQVTGMGNCSPGSNDTGSCISTGANADLNCFNGTSPGSQCSNTGSGVGG